MIPLFLGDREITDLAFGIWTIWSPCKTDYMGETYKSRSEKLKEDVKMMLKNIVNPLDQLELIDVLQRLGLAYHFEEEIDNTLNNIYKNSHGKWKENDSYATALEFRLLGQHRYHVPQEVFERFMHKKRGFKECICADVKGLLNLYEASYYSLEDERIMENAWIFIPEQLKNLKMDVDPNLAVQVSHALELPLLEDAKVQDKGLHQEELREMSSLKDLSSSSLAFSGGGKSIDLREKMSFARNRLVESYFWTGGITFEP
ncbi:terpenoid cyclases/Protein prenyltransferases superfamily protein [Actinidia rufa]|uniref:Terpenoid cyclases/Protein prenyltransferases superfamily protein n=1 Tax=Actinidia rufa TaxID=165716 RepID=A0A7J0F0M8_9ERIC|nr:terpenoid cyclases/Protein prenyltransferases superfamily protein [Actinidia rufa]